MPSPGPRARSCTECRQVKMKCDASDKFPAACSRCQRHSLECKVDPNFKRMSTRRRLEEVTSQLSDLQRAIEKPPEANASSHVSHPSPAFNIAATAPNQISPQLSSSSVHTHSPTFSSLQEGASPPEWISSLAEGSDTITWSLGNIYVDHSHARELFEYFRKFFYRHIPILEHRTSIDAVHQDDSMLFWTIILVTSKHVSQYTSLHSQLLPIFQSLISGVIVKPITSIASIHALLILSLWPVSNARESPGPRWTYCSLAFQAAMFLSLHDTQIQIPAVFGPYGDIDFVGSSRHVRQLTWMACVEISTSLSTVFGLPPMVSSTPLLDGLIPVLNDPEMPRTFAALADIQRQVAQFRATSDQTGESQVHISQIQHFALEVQTTRTRYRDVWCDTTELSLQSAIIHVAAVSFLSEDSSSEMHPATVRSVLLPAIQAAARIINILKDVDSLLTPSANASNFPEQASRLAHYPQIYQDHAFFAITFLLKYLAKDANATDLAKDHCKRNITLGYSILARMDPSLHKNHTQATLLQEFRYLLSSPQGLAGLAAPLEIRNRAGASILFDTFWKVEKMRQRASQREQAHAHPHIPMHSSPGPGFVTSPEPATSCAIATGPSVCTEESQLQHLAGVPFPGGEVFPPDSMYHGMVQQDIHHLDVGMGGFDDTYG